MLRRVFVSLLALAFLTACATTPPPPLYDGLGDSGHTISSDTALAVDYFDQGLALCWGFNHDEAKRSFEHALELDPSCAMAQWGIAYTLGPNINGPLVDPAVALQAHRAAQMALAMVRAEDRAAVHASDRAEDQATGDAVDRAAEHAHVAPSRSTPVERALIEALAVRFADPPPADRAPLDLAYADAMRAVWKRFPNEPLVGTLFADALMNINQDWRAWGTDEERGDHTLEIVGTLENVLALAPQHTGANHFYIHAVEASDNPDRGLRSASALGDLMPAAGHMVHMPAHIFMRLGMYDESVDSNKRAVAADNEFFAQAPRQGVYHLYRAHNSHFLAWAAMFRGSKGDALFAARDMESKLPTEAGPFTPVIDAYRFVPMHVMMRFGMWDEMLAEPAPNNIYKLSTALWHHGRAIAFANTERFDAARAEAANFEPLATDFLASMGDAMPANFKVELTNVLAAARHVMWGEILFREGDHEGGLAALRKGVAAEQALPYGEPPGWMQPVRHSLGALLLEVDQVDEAEAVYRADLERYADNVWSLHGLAECLRRTGRESEAIWVQKRYDEVAAHADVEITASCFCRKSES
ncbi:MAG: hypothetical protein DHS20C15_19660 [Planctomycetota bacterium]|nr:MAG: hypothetical protein DHS20C15_19660 [Planctomycetota bacterium]